jgi:penicillin-binding protein 2
MAARGTNVFFGKRLFIASAFVCFILGAITIRLWYLQGLRGSYYRDLSENNRTRTIRTAAPRGIIFDRNGNVLVGNRPAFDVALLLEDVPDVDKTIEDIANIVGRDINELRESFNNRKPSRPFEPKVLLGDASFEELSKVKANAYRLPGVIVNIAPRREYPHDALGSQTFGYVRKISKQQLLAKRDNGYFSEDVVGKAGIERQLESELRGKHGAVRVEVDAVGNRRGELGIVDYLPGKDVHLTIDLDVQRVADEMLLGQKGAVVAIDPRNGEVIAIASAPGVDGNFFSRAFSGEEWKEVALNKSRPLQHRAIGEVYPPGSTYKLLVGLAALEEKVITPRTEFKCPGHYLFAGRRYHCHKRSGHGTVNLKKAIRESCNSYYYQLGQLLGVEAMHKYSMLLGLGAPTGIALPGEKKGIVPSKEWKLNYHGERWYPGDTIPVSIGQGYLAVTPIQMAVSMAAIANDGTVFKPMLIRKIVDRVDGKEEEFSSEVVRTVPIDARLIRKYAVGVVEHQKGTGGRARIEGVSVGGKTGTAQVSALGKGEGIKELQDHAWFVAFGPAEKPSIAIAVIVENGGHGGSTAAPIAKEVMETYFRKIGVLPEQTLVSAKSEEKGSA